jgi:hypothetical protein
VFKNRLLRKISGHMREKVAGWWRRLLNEELHNLYASPNIRLIKSIRMRWAWYVACIRETRNVYKILV